MKRYIYPAIIYTDEDTGIYVLAIKDIAIVCEGETVEDVFVRAKGMLETYCECSIEFGEDIEDATPYEVTYKSNSSEIVLLVDYEIKK